jgi:hypothetical protein
LFFLRVFSEVKQQEATTMQEQIEEVKKTDAEPTEDEILTEDGLKKVAGDEEEKETPTPSSGEDKPAEEPEAESEKPDGAEAEDAEEEPAESADSEVENPSDDGGEEEVEAPPTEVKDVEGETPRERALRLEVQRVKEINRGLRGKKLIGDVQPMHSMQAELSDEDKKALEIFDPEQVSNMEKLLPVLAKKLGFVKKDELSAGTYQSTSQDVLDTWLEAHPDYLPENDKGDILFNRLKAEISLYQKPSNPKNWNKILNRAHNEIMGIRTQPKESAARVLARQEKIKVASHGQVSVPPKKSSKAPVSQSDQEQRVLAEKGGLKGFSPEELDEIFSESE